MDVKLGTVNATVARVSTDSRRVEPGDLFVALIGKRFDGHQFIKEAFERGARHFIISDPKAVPAALAGQAVFHQVPDTLRAYGDLAHEHRMTFKVPVVVITGSCGKTTVKELIAHILSQKFRVLKNQGTENNLVGVPKTLLQMDASHEVVVLELGTSLPGEIDRLAAIASPQLAVLTRIGSAHLEGLGSLEGVKREKASLIAHVERGGVIVLNGEDPMLSDIHSGVHRVLRAGFSRDSSDYVGEQAWCHERGSSFGFNRESFETPLIGRHNILNCLLSAAASASLGLDLSSIRKGLASFRGMSGRLQLRTIEGINFLDDSYNANPTSFVAALDTIKEFKARGNKGLVCGDMLELGPDSEKLHRQVGAHLAGLLLDFVIAAGPQSKALIEEAARRGFNPKRLYAVKDSHQAGQLCRELAAPGDIILVKGSRGMQMEKVFECFITSSIR